MISGWCILYVAAKDDSVQFNCGFVLCVYVSVLCVSCGWHQQVCSYIELSGEMCTLSLRPRQSEIRSTHLLCIIFISFIATTGSAYRQLTQVITLIFCLRGAHSDCNILRISTAALNGPRKRANEVLICWHVGLVGQDAWQN